MRVAAQTMIGIGCWSVLAVFVALEVQDRRLRVGAVALVCAFGLSRSIVNWDATILSDSLTVSLTVLVLAAWLRELRHPSRLSFVLVLLATLLWIFTRHSNVIMGQLTTLVAVGSVLRAVSWRRRVALAVGLMVIAGWAQYAFVQDDRIATINLHAVIIDRMVPNPEYIGWFRDHGLPGPPLTYDAVEPGSEHYSPYYTKWLDVHGRTVYARFLATHPGYTLFTPWRHVLPIENTQFEGPPPASELGLAEHYGRARSVLPQVVELVLVDPGGAGMFLLLLGAVGTGVVIGLRRWGYDSRWTLPLVVLAVNVPHVMVIWHGSPAELGRHSLALSVSTRLALFMLALFLIDRWLAHRAEAAAPV
jgi:hypothetical protein